MKSRQITLRVALFALAISPSLAIRSQNRTEPNSILNRRTANVQLRDTNLVNALTDALRQVGIPGGIAVSYYCGGFENHLLKPPDDTLRSLLDAAVAAESEYTWTVDNGVVNVVPGYDDPRFLETIIPKLEINEAETTFDALGKLMALPEVSKQATLELGIQTFGGSIGGYPNSSRTKISLSLSNVTVREALNAIARARGNGVWLLVNQECPTPTGRKFYSLQFMDL